MKCKECGEVNFNTSYLEPTKSLMIERELCFSCNFWTDRVNAASEMIVIGDNCYQDSGHVSNPKMKGY